MRQLVSESAECTSAIQGSGELGCDFVVLDADNKALHVAVARAGAFVGDPQPAIVVVLIFILLAGLDP